MKNENHDGNWLTQGSPGKNGVYICMCTCVSVCRHEEKYRAKFKKKSAAEMKICIQLERMKMKLTF